MSKKNLTILCLSLMAIESGSLAALTAENSSTNNVITCDVFVAGGGLSGTATAYESLLAGKQVCIG
jgi:hypothetical protein